MCAFTGRPPSSLTVDDLDEPWRGDRHHPKTDRGDAPPPTRRTVPPPSFAVRSRDGRPAGAAPTPGWPGSLWSTPPEIRRTLLAYLDVRATVLRPKTVNKLASAVAIFGEFVCDHDPGEHQSLHETPGRFIRAAGAQGGHKLTPGRANDH